MSNRLIFFNCVFIFLLMTHVITYGQTTPMPTPVAGTNNVTFVSATNTFKFYHNGILRYEYQIPLGTTTNGGTFNLLKAYADDGSSFLPSNYGGIRAILSGQEKYPWDPGVTFTRMGYDIINGEAYSRWKMMWNGDYCYYNYRMKIVGRTLIIKVAFETTASGGNKATELNLDRSENTATPKPIKIPYLSLFYVMLSNSGTFTSLFVDWEASNSSNTIHFDGSYYSSSSLRYTQVTKYLPKTNGQRNTLTETIYLTTSQNLNDVLPNLPNPTSPYYQEVANNIVWDYRDSFDKLISPTGDRFMERVYEGGARNIWVQIHNWQKDHPSTPNWTTGYDDGLPCVLPANTNYGGPNKLNQVIEKARNQYNYRIGVHHNYVDYYPNASLDCQYAYAYDPTDRALNSTGNPIEAYHNWYNPDQTYAQAYLLKPSRTSAYVSYWTDQIKLAHNINGCYLDVHSGILPSTNYVDYDANVTNAGMFKETMNKYRSLYPIMRNIISGPIQGEGGNQLFYQGYVDDIEARLIDPETIFYGIKFPLLLDFDLIKQRGKSFVHGVGYYPIFFHRDSAITATKEQVLTYMATEIAYGHGGYIPDPGTSYNIVEHAKIEYDHVYSLQQYLVNATPVSIQYGNSLQTASDYIKTHPGYADITNYSDFMGKVKVTYSNGIIVYVNRHPSETWTVNVGTSGKWFSYHAIPLDGTAEEIKLYAGNSKITAFELPPNNGWVVYNPLIQHLYKPGIEIENLSLPKEFALQQNYPNPFNPVTILKYQLSEDSKVQIKVYDILGKEVAELVNQDKAAGYYEVEFNGSNLASGIYFYRIQAGDFVDTKKMILMK